LIPFVISIEFWVGGQSADPQRAGLVGHRTRGGSTLILHRDRGDRLKSQANPEMNDGENCRNRLLSRTYWYTLSVHRLLPSGRPVQIFNLKEANGLVSMPISPTNLFVAANEDAIFAELRE
jgi:hypothetical protein